MEFIICGIGVIIGAIIYHKSCAYLFDKKNKEIKVLSDKLTELSAYIIEVEKEKRELEELLSIQSDTISNINKINIDNITVSPN